MFRQKIPINYRAHFPPETQEKYHINFSSVVAIGTLRLLCGHFAQVRNNCFHVDNMKKLFQDLLFPSKSCLI